MGTKCDGDHLSMGTNCLGDLMSLGTKWTGTICPLGPNVSGDQVSWGPNVSQPNGLLYFGSLDIQQIFKLRGNCLRSNTLNSEYLRKITKTTKNTLTTE